MSVINNVTVDFTLSPRIVNIPIPLTQVTLQDLHDTLREIEDDPSSMGYPKLISSAGKENLGGGVSVGITSTLNDAKVSFEPRLTPNQSGTATSNGTNQKTLIDTSATFQTNNVSIGQFIINYTDQSISTVTSVVSETELKHTVLQNGTLNEWSINDAYDIFPVEQMEITGGNLVAIDSGLSDITPIFPTPFNQVVKTSSSSATIAELQIEELKFLIETQRPHHSGIGDTYYIDPINGDDNNPGNTSKKAFRTFSRAHQEAKDWNHDVIQFFPGNGNGVTTLDETINITKNYLFLRGPGRDFRIKPSDNAGNPTIQINAEGVEISSMLLETDGVSSVNCIEIRDNFSLLENVFIDSAGLSGINISNSRDSRITKSTIKDCGNDGIEINSNTFDITISKTTILGCTDDGIEIVGTDIDNIEITTEVNIINNGDYGLHVGTGVTNVVLNPDTTFYNNANGDTLDVSNSIGFGGRIRDIDYGGFIHYDSVNGFSGVNFPRGSASVKSNNISDAKIIADRVGVNSYKIHDTLIVTQDHTSWEFVGNASLPVVSINSGIDVSFSTFREVVLTGNLSGSGIVRGERILIINASNLEGTFGTTGLDGVISLASGTRTTITEGFSRISNSLQPIIDFGVGISSEISFHGYSGDITFRNMDQVGDISSISLRGGAITLENNCTNGNLIISGVGEIINNSNGINLDTSGFINKREISDYTWDELQSNHLTSGTMGSQIDKIKKDTALIPGIV